MKQLIILLFCLLVPNGAKLYAQAAECLPQTYSLSIGGSLALPAVDGNRNDFFSKNGNRPGYGLTAEGRYHFGPHLAAGVQYDYLRAAAGQDKMHVHFARPELVLRHLWSRGNQAAFFSLGIGYLDYQERTYAEGRRHGHLYHKGYCGISFALGWEFRISRKVSGVLRADVLTADWFANPEARLFNPDKGYDDGIDHRWFKSHITFVNLGFGLQFGK